MPLRLDHYFCNFLDVIVWDFVVKEITHYPVATFCLVAPGTGESVNINWLQFLLANNLVVLSRIILQDVEFNLRPVANLINF